MLQNLFVWRAPQCVYPMWVFCGLGPLEWERDGSDWETRHMSDGFNRWASTNSKEGSSRRLGSNMSKRKEHSICKNSHKP